MPATALSQQPTAAALPILAKRERFPAKITKAVRLLVSGECKTQKAAAERVGMNASYLSEQLAKPRIQAFVARESRRALASGAMRASARLLELVDAESEHVSAQVAQRILTNEGILKSDQSVTNVQVDVRAGFVIDLSDQQAKSKVIDQ